jgi:VCBS repeat protein
LGPDPIADGDTAAEDTMLHRTILLVLVTVAACKGSHGQSGDAGTADTAMPDGAPDAPPDGGSACHGGLAWLPWISSDHTPTDAAVGDVNGDGIPDVLVGTQDDATVHVWLGTGGGRFRQGASYAMHDGARGAIAFALADLDHDGKLDLVVASSDLIVRLGHGDGTFGGKIVSPAGGAASGVTVGDVSHDGKLDVVVVYGLAAQLGVLLGNGDGTFAAAVTYATAQAPTPAVIADVSGDGKPDLVVGAAFNGKLGVLIGNGDGSFQPRIDHDLPQVATGIAVGDLDHDGALDVVAVANNEEPFNASVLYGHGDASFPREIDFEAAPSPVAVALADVNGDGRPDVVTTHDLQGTVDVQLDQVNGIPSFLMSSAQAGGFPTSSVLADLDGDGKLDFVAPNRLGNNVSVELGNGDGTFRDTPRGGPAAFYLLADLDLDGHLDAVGPRTSLGPTPPTSIIVQLGKPDGSFHDPVDVAVASPPQDAVAADLDHDGKLDLVVLTDSKTESVLLGNGDGTFQPRIDRSAPDVSRIAAADLDGDGKADLVEAHSGDAPFLRVQRSLGGGQFEAGMDIPLPGATGFAGPFTLVDLDGDGVRDIAVLAGDNLTVLLGNGDASFHHKIDVQTGIAPYLLAAADVTGDGKLDLVLVGRTDAAGNVVRVMRGAGNGTFMTRGDVAVTAPDLLAVADVTRDGVPDIVTYGFDAHTLDVLAGDGDGALQPRIEYGGVATLAAIAIADTDHDGQPEILLAGGSRFTTACRP